jgi:hypothetical protein
MDPANVYHPAPASEAAAAPVAIPVSSGARVALDRAITTWRVSYRGVLLALAVAAARFVADHYGAPLRAALRHRLQLPRH